MATETMDEKAKELRKFAKEYFEKTYPSPKEQRKMSKMFGEVKWQIKICCELCCPITEDIIKDWIENGSLAYILSSVRSLKFA